MDLLAVVSRQLFLLFQIPGPQELLDVSRPIFTACHEPDLARRVGGNGGVSVLDSGKDLFAGFIESLDPFEMEPWAFSCSREQGSAWICINRGELLEYSRPSIECEESRKGTKKRMRIDSTEESEPCVVMTPPPLNGTAAQSKVSGTSSLLALQGRYSR